MGTGVSENAQRHTRRKKLIMKNNVFFLNKEQAADFQNRCVIAIFLDTHPNVKFNNYIKRNTFLGTIDESKMIIYLFAAPSNEEKGCVFRSRNRKVSNPIHEYRLFSKQFMDEYAEYRSDVYKYIMEHFFTRWSQYFEKKLFVSEEPKIEKIFKYKKSVVEEESGKMDRYYKAFLDGALVFSNPKRFNDPFDCDSELPDLNSKINLLWNAFNCLKYSGKGSTSTKKKDIEKILKEVKIVNNENDNIKDIICRIIDEGKKDDQDESKPTKQETIDAILEAYRRMEDQVHNLKERFRVFCTTNKPDDILMWGYYCEGGDGVCCKYDYQEIINSISNERSNCICVYGTVDYKDEKPQYEYVTTDLADNIFEYVIRCVFTKFTGWRHENEFRYVLMENNFGKDHVCVNSSIQKYYLGCTISSVLTERYLDSKSASIRKLKKSGDKYKIEMNSSPLHG